MKAIQGHPSHVSRGVHYLRNNTIRQTYIYFFDQNNPDVSNTRYPYLNSEDRRPKHSATTRAFVMKYFPTGG